MDAATSTLNHSFNVGPNLPHGNPQAQGPANLNQGPMPASFSEDQQHHHKPFFYIQPSQPYLPMQSVQWPLPLAMPFNLNPYYGYQGFGYSMPMMPPYQPNPYMETPGFVVPHTHLHLMDYRRMLNPQYYQSMAYHARRLRYQQNLPNRGVTSSEVQTEPLPTAQRTSTQSLNNSETCNESSNLSTTLSIQKDDHTLALKDLAPSSTNATPSKGSFVIETEEVRIECCTTPAGLQVLHSRETAEMSHSFSQDVVQCSSMVQSSMHPEDNFQLPKADNNKTEQSQQPCPDILIVGIPGSNDKIPELETTPTNQQKSKMVDNIEATFNEKDLKVVHFPFDAKYLEELRKRESTVWSTEDTLVPSPEFVIQSFNETLPGEAETLVAHKQNEEVVPVTEMPLTMEEELQDLVPCLESLADQVTNVRNQACSNSKIAIEHSPNALLSDDLPLDGNIQSQQDTSFESSPAYLPSSSWLADFDSVRYCKMPPTPQKPANPKGNRSFDMPTRRRKLDAEFQEAAVICKTKERYKPKGKVDRRSLSDHECCVSRSYNENTYVPYALKGQRLCTRCTNKQRVYNTSASPGIERQVTKRKTTPFQQWNEVILPTCEACKGHAKKRFARKGSNPDVRIETEGESSENSLSRKWRLMEEMRKDLKRPLAQKQNVEKCPATVNPKLREKNCSCNEHHQSPWKRIYHCPHGNAIREMDENSAVPMSVQEKLRNMDQMYLAHRWQTEKSWKAVMPGHNAEGIKNDFRAQHMNKHRNSLPLSQGVYRMDTRC